MSKSDILWESIPEQIKATVSKEEFNEAILYLEMQKLLKIGLMDSKEFGLNEIKDLIYNKVRTNLNNVIPTKKDRCMVKYCRQKQVKASHVISKVFLKNICNKSGKNIGKLFTPVVNLEGPKLNVMPLGVGVAFRFPGFCEKHENWFDFEKKKDIETTTDAYKQIFRSICYEKYIQAQMIANEKEGKKILLEDVIRKNNDFISANSILEIKLSSVKNKQTQFIKRTIQTSINERRKLITELDEFYNDVNLALEKDEGQILLYQIKLNLTLPIAYTHCGGLTLVNGKKVRLIAANILIPLPSGSLIIIASQSKYRKQLTQLWTALQGAKAVEVFIYKTLAEFTENWLIQPDFWENSLSSNLKSKILNQSLVYK